MRLIGHIESDKDARTFGDFLYVQGIDNEADQLLVTPLREFDSGELRSDSVCLRRPPGPWARASCPPLEGGNQEPGFRESFEPTPRDVAVHPVRGGNLIGRHRKRLRACEQERLAKVAITDRVESMHHF